MRFVSRAAWGAAYAKGSSPIAGPVLGVTCHWEGPHMGDFPHDQCARKVKSIERFHAVTRGWSGIAYTAVVCPHGYVFEGRGIGVRSAANGDSNIGGNDRWYAVCYLGGQGDGFTDAGKQGMTDAITWLRANGAGQKVNGHRDHHPTECPGDEIYRWLPGAVSAKTAPTPQEDDMQLSDDIYAAKDKTKTVGAVLRRLDRFMDNSTERDKAMRAQLRAAIKRVDDLPAGATKDDVKRLLEGLDATIQLVVTEAPEE